MDLHTLLSFLLLLLSNRGLTASTLKVYTADIIAHQPTHSEAASLFQHPTVKQFLKGLKNLCPTQNCPVPQWSLTIILNRLTRFPFEPMGSISVHMLSLKIAFLLAITSAHRSSELTALHVDPPFLQFHPNKITVYPDISFLPKVVSDFHLTQLLVLPTFFPSLFSNLERTLHTLDVRRTLLFYTSRTVAFRKSQRLFVCTSESSIGSPVTSQTISSWITEVIRLSYDLAAVPLPEGPLDSSLTWHSKRRWREGRYVTIRALVSSSKHSDLDRSPHNVK
ncbi:hypothetical protein JRQ81_003291 [Phrynocephalus forsythii]|uniref:Uncharacterized protein n=1 Tax=Phrynocephalus forsythii TaxID=171643 RepID=A0A9Q1AXA9_9SAUR|nr:hypothetical protein JRQ81_003291 [Phrynocephalus forsythii]